MTDKQPTEKKETETAATFTEELTAVLEEIKEEPVKEKKKGEGGGGPGQKPVSAARRARGAVRPH